MQQVGGSPGSSAECQLRFYGWEINGVLGRVCRDDTVARSMLCMSRLVIRKTEYRHVGALVVWSWRKASQGTQQTSTKFSRGRDSRKRCSSPTDTCRYHDGGCVMHTELSCPGRRITEREVPLLWSNRSPLYPSLVPSEVAQWRIVTNKSLEICGVILVLAYTSSWPRRTL